MKDLAWNAGTGAVAGVLGGTFSRAMGYPGGYYGWIGTALEREALKAKERAILSVNAGVANGIRNGVGGITGALPNERASEPQECSCRR